MRVFEVVIDKQFGCLFEAFANVPENTTTAAWKDVQLGHTDFRLPGVVLVVHLLFPTSMATGSHAVDQFGGLDMFELLRGHWLRVVTNDHFDCQPGRNYQSRIDFSLTESRPMGFRPVLRILASKAKCLHVRSRLVVKTVDPLDRVSYPRILLVALKPRKSGPAVWIEHLGGVTELVRATVTLV